MGQRDGYSYSPPPVGGPATWPRIRILKPGVVMENWDCSGCYVSIEASDVTVRNCRFTAVNGIAIVVDLYNGATGLTVDRCHFDGEKLDPGSDTLLRARDGTMTVRDCLFENLPSDAIKMVGGTVERCTFRAAGYAAGAHADAITVMRSVAPVRIVDNDIDYRMPPDAKTRTTSAIAVGPQNGDIEDVLIERNRLFGGAYTIYVTTPPGPNPRYRTSRVVVRDNVIGGWMFGPLYPNHRPADLVFTNNRQEGGAKGPTRPSTAP